MPLEATPKPFLDEISDDLSRAPPSDSGGIRQHYPMDLQKKSNQFDDDMRDYQIQQQMAEYYTLGALLQKAGFYKRSGNI